MTNNFQAAAAAQGVCERDDSNTSLREAQRRSNSSQVAYYPPEWAEQSAVWLAYPHNLKEWSERGSKSECGLEQMRKFTHTLISAVLDFQDLRLAFPTAELLAELRGRLEALAANKKYSLHLHVIPNNDIWIRDFGPFFVFKDGKKVSVDFAFNAWGEKFPPWDLDDVVPKLMARELNCDYEHVPMILEGGSLEFNGTGVVMTTEQCLLNKNRNPELSREQIEDIIKVNLGQEHIIWLKRGLEGDHTDGHIDDFARFISEDTVLLCQTDDINDPNYQHLRDSKQQLENWCHPETGASLRIITLPLPRQMFANGVVEPLPCSYANFIFVNGGLIVPVFNCPQDSEAIEILTKALPDRKIVTLDGSFLIEGGGGIHCMSKQEPA